MSGVEVVRALREMGNPLYVVGCTGNALREDQVCFVISYSSSLPFPFLERCNRSAGPVAGVGMDPRGTQVKKKETDIPGRIPISWSGWYNPETGTSKECP